MNSTIEQASTFDQREAIFKKATRKENLTIDEMAVVSDLGRDYYEAELRRMRSVLKNQKLAGTTSQRKAATKKLANVKEKMATELLRISDDIMDLRQKAIELESQVKDAETVVAQHKRAVSQLRYLVPVPVKKSFDTARSILNRQPQTKRMHELKSRIRQIENLAAIDVSNLDGQEKAKSHAMNHAKQAVDSHDMGNNRTRYTLNETAWKSYIAKLTGGLQALKDEHSKLKTEYDAGMAETSKTLDYYVP